MSRRHRQDPVIDLVVTAGNIGRSARPSKSFIPTGPAGRPSPADPTAPQAGRLRLIPPGTGDVRGDEALTARATATILAGLDWCDDIGGRLGMALDAAERGGDVATVTQPLGAEVDRECGDAEYDLRLSAWGMGSPGAHDAANRLAAMRTPLRAIVPLDTASAAQWTPERCCVRLTEVLGELTEVRAALRTAGTALGLDLKPPPDLEAAWWHRVQNLEVEVGQAGQRVEAMVVTHRVRSDGQSAAGVVLGQVSDELGKLADLAADLAAEASDG